MTTLRIHDWDTWQTFRKDRGAPPWIKVHRSLLSCRKWASLSDAEKGQLVSIWMVAADNNGEILADPRFIRKICQLDDTPDIQKFIDLGLMASACQPDDNHLATKRPHVDAPEESRGEKSREETDLGDKPPVSVPSRKRFVIPTAEEVEAYCQERGNGISGQQFVDANQAKGWVVGKSPMKDWKAAVRTWETYRKGKQPPEPIRIDTVAATKAMFERQKREAANA